MLIEPTTIRGKVTIVSAMPLNLPIIPIAVEYSKPMDTSLLGTTKVDIVENILPINPFKQSGNDTTKTLNSNWAFLSGFS